MASIIVKNNDWDSARAELKTSFEVQQSAFDARLKAIFAPPAAEGKPAEPKAKAAPKPPKASKPVHSHLPRSRWV